MYALRTLTETFIETFGMSDPTIDAGPHGDSVGPTSFTVDDGLHLWPDKDLAMAPSTLPRRRRAVEAIAETPPVTRPYRLLALA